MRPHVAGASPIHGHPERAGGFPEEPVSPITGTRFENARSTKMVHIAEFTADLIRHGKLRLDPRRNNHLRLTFHDSCNPSRAMGCSRAALHPAQRGRPFLRNARKHDPGEHLCCGAAPGWARTRTWKCACAAVSPGQRREIREGKARREPYGVHLRIDRAVFVPLLEYWVPGWRSRAARTGGQRLSDERGKGARNGPAGGALAGDGGASKCLTPGKLLSG